jgi:hypothetical protein
MKNRPRVGRPRVSPLDRGAQLRAAKRRQRARQRRENIVPVQLELPADQAERLRVARRAPGFGAELEALLDEAVVDIHAWPALRELAWNRRDRWIPAAEALSLYERNWRFIDPARLEAREAHLIDRLRAKHGGGTFGA